MSGLILVVDDDEGIQEFLQVALEEEGYEVMIAEDGKRALELLATSRPDLVVLDLMMPRMNGFDFVRALEERGQRRALSLLLLTAHAQAKAQASILGVDNYLQKPFDLLNLLEAVDMALMGKQERC